MLTDLKIMQACLCLGKRAEFDHEFNILDPLDNRLRKERLVTTPAAHLAGVGGSRLWSSVNLSLPSKRSKSKDKTRI